MLGSMEATAGESAHEQPVTGSSSSARAAARAVIAGPPSMDCDRAVQTITVDTRSLGATNAHPHGALVISCGIEAGRLSASVLPLRADGTGGSAGGQVDVTSTPGPDTAGSLPAFDADHAHVIRFQRNFE